MYKVPEIRLMNDEELSAEIGGLEQKVSEAKDVFRTANDEAFEVSRKYTQLQAQVNELREEWLGLCEAVKKFRNNPGKHYTGLVLIEAKVRREYGNTRLESLRNRRKSIEVLAKVKQYYRDYVLLEAEYDYLKAIRRRREVEKSWYEADADRRGILSQYAEELEADIFVKGNRLERLKEEFS